MSMGADSAVAYGLVLRFQPDLLVSSANPARDDKNGEWRPLKYSNWLLGKEFHFWIVMRSGLYF